MASSVMFEEPCKLRQVRESSVPRVRMEASVTRTFPPNGFDDDKCNVDKGTRTRTIDDGDDENDGRDDEGEGNEREDSSSKLDTEEESEAGGREREEEGGEADNEDNDGVGDEGVGRTVVVKARIAASERVTPCALSRCRV